MSYWISELQLTWNGCFEYQENIKTFWLFFPHLRAPNDQTCHFTWNFDDEQVKAETPPPEQRTLASVLLPWKQSELTHPNTAAVVGIWIIPGPRGASRPGSDFRLIFPKRHEEADAFIPSDPTNRGQKKKKNPICVFVRQHRMHL